MERRAHQPQDGRPRRYDQLSCGVTIGSLVASDSEDDDLAAQYPLGTVLRPVFDRDTEDWRYESA